MTWEAFWVGLSGALIPSIAASVIMLMLSHHTNRALAQYRSQLERQLQMFSAWHGHRITALIDVYEAFREYLRFLRLHFYFEGDRDLTPLHEFREAMDRNLVFLDDQLREPIVRFQSELLQFYNWAFSERQKGEGGLAAVRRRLDFEIPNYLEELRKLFNEYSGSSKEPES